MRLRELLLSLTDAPAEQQVENVNQVIAVESKPTNGDETAWGRKNSRLPPSV
jgi:hypothetical protein